MNGRASVWVLWVGVAALALTDWMVGGSIAQERGGPIDPAAPTRVPRGADLTQSLRQPITIDGVRLELVTSTSGRYTLRAVNDGAEPKRLALSVECWDTVGSPMSRMGPMPRQVANVPVELALAAHETVTRLLALPPAPRRPAGDSAGSNEGALAGMGWIATRDIRISVARAGGDVRGRPLAELAVRQPAVADAAQALGAAQGAEPGQASPVAVPGGTPQAGRAAIAAPASAAPIGPTNAARQARRGAHGDARVGS